MKKPLRWGLLAVGEIAKAFAFGLSQTQTGKAMAVASRSMKKAKDFAAKHKIAKAYGSYQDMLEDPEIDAVYISTPHPWHAEWTIKAAEAGKHVLVEKPIALHAMDAKAMVDAALKNKVFLMEAFMYRCHPQTAKIADLIREKAIGEIRLIRASFGFMTHESVDGRLLGNAMGGGGIMDVGCYPVSMSRLIAGAAMGCDFADPVEVTGYAHIGSQSRVDEWACGALRFEQDIFAQVSTSVMLDQDKDLVVFGTKGTLYVPHPWCEKRDRPSQGEILLRRDGKKEEAITISETKTAFALEAETVAANLEKKQALSPAMSWDDTLGNMRTLDRWRKAVGLEFESDKQ